MTQTPAWPVPTVLALPTQSVRLTSRERLLLRRLIAGWDLVGAANSAGLSLSDTQAALLDLQDRTGVSSLSRLLALAILKSWV